VDQLTRAERFEPLNWVRRIAIQNLALYLAGVQQTVPWRPICALDCLLRQRLGKGADHPVPIDEQKGSHQLLSFPFPHIRPQLRGSQ
jgi:hypothetical protein